MKENGVYDELYTQKPVVALDIMTYDIDTYKRQDDNLKYFDWERIHGASDSEHTRKVNAQSLWFRPTIDWKLNCEDSLSRSNAYKIFSMELETLRFANNIFPVGLMIIILTLVPHIAYIRMTE